MKYVYILRCTTDGILGVYGSRKRARQAALEFCEEMGHTITDQKHHDHTSTYWTDFDQVAEIEQHPEL